MNKNSLKFRGLEIAVDNIRIEEHLLPPGETLDGFGNRKLEYFKKYGFKVTETFSQLYEKYNGIHSEKYIPTSLYFYYINPYLVNMNLSMAYVDKNAYCRLFPQVKQPETLVQNINGRFYHYGEEILKDKAAEILLSEEEYIIKPAIESGCGRDVSLVRPSLLGGYGGGKIPAGSLRE